MQTLIEFINLTKGIEYLIAVVFLISFPLFWKILDGKPKHGKQTK